MEETEDIMDEIDLIARSTNTDEFDSVSREEENPDFIPLPYTNKDKQFFGFNGLYGFVYRVCSPVEYIGNGIYCKPCTTKQSKRSIAQHVASGSRHPSRYISTSASLEIASLWAYYKMETDDRLPRDIPHRIIQIALELLKGTRVEAGCANLTNDSVREHFIKGNRHRCFAKSSNEVLFTDNIPQFRSFDNPIPFWRYLYPGENGHDSIPFRDLNLKKVYWLITPPVPKQPPPKKKKKKHNQQNLSEELFSKFAKLQTSD